MLTNISNKSEEPDLPNSSPLIMSTGTGESEIERGAPRDPTTAIFSTLSSVPASWANTGEIETTLAAADAAMT